MKNKNANTVLAMVFAAISFLLGVGEMIYVLVDCPFGLYFTIETITSLLTIATSIVLYFGILKASKGTIIGAAVTGAISSVSSALCSAALAVANGYVGSARALFRTYEGGSRATSLMALLLIPAVGFVLSACYANGAVKSKKTVVTFLTLAWVIEGAKIIFTSGQIGMIFIISALIVLILYSAVDSDGSSVNMPEVFFLSVVTFGIYYIIWFYSVAKKINNITGKQGIFAQTVFYILFYPYRIYWYYTRCEDLKNSRPELREKGVLCTVLSLLGLSVVSLALIQRDLNTIVDFERTQEEPIISAE